MILLAGDSSITNDDVLLFMIDPSYKLVGFNLNVPNYALKDEELAQITTNI